MGWARALALGGLGIALASCTGTSHHPSAAPSHPAAHVSAVARTLDLGSGETFAPPPANAHPRLTAQQAWVAYARRAHARINRTHLPAGTTAQLGVFTGGGGRHLAYGIFTPNSAPIYTLVVPSPPVLCTEWTMLNANTGAHIESSWFRCPPTSLSPIPRPSTKG